MRWPCPCCGHLTLLDGPGRYELCTVCSYEDDPDQLRWPMRAGGSSGVSLVECQGAYNRSRQVEERRDNSRRSPTESEPLDEGFRPFDPHRDWADPALPGGRWPVNPEALYWWRPTYWNGRQDMLPARERERTGGDDFADELVRELPEAFRTAERLNWTYGEAHPWRLLEGLADLTIESFRYANVEFADRVIALMEAELDRARGTGGLVAGAFLDRPGWHDPRVRAHQDTWPPRLRQRWDEHAAALDRLHAPGPLLRIARRVAGRKTR